MTGFHANTALLILFATGVSLPLSQLVGNGSHVDLAKGMQAGSVESYIATALASSLLTWGMLFARNITSFINEDSEEDR